MNHPPDASETICGLSWVNLDMGNRAMATSDDLLQLNSFLPDLARTIFGAARDTFGGSAWVAVVLDARFFEDDTIMSKIRAELADGSFGSVKVPHEGSRLLRSLCSVRPDGKERWYGLRLRVTADGGCDTAFDYDPATVDDETFWDS